MLFLKYSKDKEKLPEILKRDEERFKQMDKRAMDVIEAVTNVELKDKEETGMGEMCQAIRDLRDEEYLNGYRQGEREGYRQGEQEGYRQGEQEGYRQGEQEGYRQGEQEGYRQAALKMYGKGNSPKQIADTLDVDGGQVEKWLGLMKA